MDSDNEKLIRQSMFAQHLNAASLVSDKEKDSQKSLELNEKAYSEKKCFEEGYALFLEEMTKESIDEEASASLNKLEFWKNYLEHPESLQELLDYSDEMLLNLYNLATHFYENKQNVEAVNGYKFLCLLDPEISSFWVGLGLALEANNEPAKGMEAFEHGIKSSSSEFAPYLGAIRCSQKLNDFTRTIELLTEASKNTLLEKDAKAALEYIARTNK